MKKKPKQPPILTRLAEIVRSHGVLQSARNAGMTGPSVSRLLRGDHVPTLETVTRLAEALGYRLELVPNTKE